LDSAIVDAAAASGVEIITRHRKTIDRAQRITAKLLDRVEQAVESEEVDLTKQVIMLKELSNAAKNWTALERQAFNLDTMQETAPLEERLKKIYAQAG